MFEAAAGLPSSVAEPACGAGVQKESAVRNGTAEAESRGEVGGPLCHCAFLQKLGGVYSLHG